MENQITTIIKRFEGHPDFLKIEKALQDAFLLGMKAKEATGSSLSPEKSETPSLSKR